MQIGEDENLGEALAVTIILSEKLKNNKRTVDKERLKAFNETFRDKK